MWLLLAPEKGMGERTFVALVVITLSAVIYLALLARRVRQVRGTDHDPDA